MQAKRVFTGMMLLGLVGGFAYAGEEAYVDHAADYNCKSKAKEMKVGEGDQTFTFVRSWTEGAGTWYDPVTGQEIPAEGTWTDRLPDSADVQNQLGTCWLYVTLEKGKDYVLSLDTSFVSGLSFEIKAGTQREGLQFKQDQQIVDGRRYYSIKASDWLPMDTAKVEFYVHADGKGVVGKELKLAFFQKALKDVLPANLGSAAKPREIDVSESGSRVIDDPVEVQFGRRSTAYAAQLKANVEYKFKAEYPVSSDNDPWATFAFPDGFEWARSIAQVKTFTGGAEMTFKITEDRKLVFLVLPDIYSPAGASVAGGTLSWTVGSEPPAEPVKAGTYRGEILALPDGSEDPAAGIPAAFSLVEKVMNKGALHFDATVEIASKGLTYSFVDNGDGELVYEEGSRKSYLWVTLPQTDEGKIELEGEIWIGEKKFWLKGSLAGALVNWESSFLRVDATKQSAKDMGITSGGFKDEPTNSVTLVKLQKWGAANNVWIASVNNAEFSAQGDPVDLCAKAFLLDCPPAEAMVQAAEARFVITSFDPVNGVVVVAGDVKNGEPYGNGKVEIRTSTEVGGTYDVTSKGRPDTLFYKAYLVK